jgi:hypothetical protein
MDQPLVIPTPGLAIDRAAVAETGVQMQMPFRLGATFRSLWLLPLEPLVAVRGKNVITRRTIAKLKDRSFGSVKELWTKDDYEIIITGMLYDHTQPNQLPQEMITRLDGLCSLKKPLYAQCALLEALGASQIVVDSWEFPPTPGIGWQAYSIKAFSDQNFNLFIEK